MLGVTSPPASCCIPALALDVVLAVDGPWNVAWEEMLLVCDVVLGCEGVRLGGFGCDVVLVLVLVLLVLG